MKIILPSLDGRVIAEKIISNLLRLKNPQKIMAAVLVGDNKQSLSFIKQKEKIAKRLGIGLSIFQYEKNISEPDLIKNIKNICAQKNVGGVITQLPLPDNFNREKVLSAISPEKDVDALTDAGKKLVLPPSVGTVKEILRTTDYELRAKVVVVVGTGFLVGKPILEYLKGKCGELIGIDIGGDLNQLKNADLIICGTGHAGLIKPAMLKNGAVVIDFGYSLKDGKLMGDFDALNVPPKARLAIGGKSQMLNVGFYTPTPGGTGPILVAELFRNFYELNK